MKEQDKDRPVSSGLEEIFGSAAVQSDEASECQDCSLTQVRIAA